VPEVGPPPDLISDDLPTNLDYLDASFGTAAGLRELRDDDLDEFDLDDKADLERIPYSIGGPQTGIISSVGGETIKILRPDGIRIVENYFDSLLPDTTSRAGE
jgi:autophagy-related protein 2